MHPVTFFDRPVGGNQAAAVKEGVADFRPNYAAVPLAARMGPPAHPGVAQPEPAAVPEPVQDSQPTDEAGDGDDDGAAADDKLTEPVKTRSAAPN